jgi:hypothetical protein
MHLEPPMREDTYIDRAKHDVDVLEQVFRGVRPEPARAGQPHVVDLGAKPWAAGHVLSAVQVQVVALESDERRRD